MEPLVSVIIPFYNGVGWLEEAVESVFLQNYPNIEIIVVNDGSKEDVSQFLQKYGDRIKYYYQENAGPGKARNNGLSHANGKYIALLDSDDLWTEGKLRYQINYMEENPHIMWSHTSYETFGFGDDRVVDTSSFSGNVFIKSFISCTVATPCVVIRKSVLDENPVLRFSETMRYGQDFYLWVLLSYMYEIGATKDIYSKVRMRGSNAAKRAYVMLKAKKELWQNLENNKAVPLDRVPFPIKFSYKWCGVFFNVVTFIEKSIKNKKLIEFISKVFYIVPYVILKILK